MAAEKKELFLIRWWYEKSPFALLLLPFSLLFWLISISRRKLFQFGLYSSFKPPIPTIVVGNITVGGTGKTPLVIALIKALQQHQFKPGVISRGYSSQASRYPFAVTGDSKPTEAGDEPLLIAKRTKVPVVIDAVRSEAAKYLIEHTDCDVIIADDGLQHYALQRDIEIVVVDKHRAFGNQLLLPAGPLRETVGRLSTVDLIVANGGAPDAENMPSSQGDLRIHAMHLDVGNLVNVLDGSSVASSNWAYSKTVHAVAGIGNPQRFYNSLRKLGFTLIEHSYGDHHNFKRDDLVFDDDLPIIMTEKDAIKMAQLDPSDNYWFLPVNAKLDEPFFTTLLSRLRQLSTES